MARNINPAGAAASKSLAELGLAAAGNPDRRISGLCASSRLVEPGNLFVALPGINVHGASFAGEAIERGAAAILTDRPGAEIAGADARHLGIEVVSVQDARLCLARLAARWFGRAPDVAVAVTGTNGKSSVAGMCRQIWEMLDRTAASFGTLGVEGIHAAPLHHTTPDPIALHALLADLHDSGVTHVALEASSHGLRQHRLAGVEIVAAAFSNLTHDHLDYHVDMQAYFDAKAILFERILPATGSAVIWTDREYGRKMAEIAARNAGTVLTLGDAGSDVRILSQLFSKTGQAVKFEWQGREFNVELNLPGAFQARNALTAAALAVASGESLDEVIAVLGRLQTVRGRLELAATRRNGAPVFVDYAHTPHALETVLTSLRPHFLGRLIVVFGAGGERDRTKRAKMGATATELADVVLVTDDNPRGENPAAIRAEILHACPGGIEIADRAEAILRGANMLEPGDVLLIAGKGHETGQEVDGVMHPFNDAEQASMAVNVLDGTIA